MNGYRNPEPRSTGPTYYNTKFTKKVAESTTEETFFRKMDERAGSTISLTAEKRATIIGH